MTFLRHPSARRYNRSTVTCAALALVIAAMIPFSDVRGEKQEPYYGFYPSKLGQTHKKFVHNIFGFAIDIPSNWVFGVVGPAPVAVAVLYPEGLNTREFSDEWETIEIGRIPAVGLTLEEALDTTIRGARAKHPDLTLDQRPTKCMVNRMHGISCAYQWQSRTGFTVIEKITLIQAANSIRSIAVRTTRKDYRSRSAFYDGIIKTFEVFTPKH